MSDHSEYHEKLRKRRKKHRFYTETLPVCFAALFVLVMALVMVYLLNFTEPTPMTDEQRMHMLYSDYYTDPSGPNIR